MRPPIPLALEIGRAPRAAGSLSRLAGRGGGTTLPGKLLWKLDPGAIDRLAARLPQGSVLDLGDERQDDDGGDGGRDPAAAGARSRTTTRARTSSRGVASTLLHARGAELGLFEVDEARCSEVARRCGRRRCCSATSSATSSTATASSSSSPPAGATAVAALPDAQLVVNGDDPQVGDLARDRPGTLDLRRSTTRGTPAPRCSTRPTRSTACAAARRTTTPPPTSATSATTAARTAATRGRRSTSSRARSSCDGLDGAVVHARRAGGRGARRAGAAGPLQRLQRARRGGARAGARRAARRDRRRASGASRPPSVASSGSRSATGGC